MTYLHTEIDLVRMALRRHEARVDEMASTWARERMPCCPGCAFGSTYTDAVDQCTRTRSWLVVLLKKRGRPKDLAEVQRLVFDGVA